MKWTKYKAIGTDPVTRRVYLRYELFSAMRKLDVQFTFIMLVSPRMAITFIEIPLCLCVVEHDDFRMLKNFFQTISCFFCIGCIMGFTPY